MNLKKTLLFLVIIVSVCETAQAKGRIYSDNIRTLVVTAGDDWISPPVTELNGGETIYISFDEMSHDYRRLVYHIDHCEADWTVSEELFESDYLQGFNDNPIEDYETSLNTIYLYTHYELEIPNDRCKLKISGNYRVTIYDDDDPDTKLLEAEFMVVEPLMSLTAGVTTNTDIDVNKEHQQIEIGLDYEDVRVTLPAEQIYTVVTQNDREDNRRINVKPNIRHDKGLEWTHNRELIFDGGNEYHKHEVLDLSHATMGIDYIDWDGENFNVYPFKVEERPNYLYDEDANGAFFIRNSDNEEIDYTCDYALVHYRVNIEPLLGARLIIDGRWTDSADKERYVAQYSMEDNMYHLTLLQKQGYYSYQFLGLRADGTTFIPPSEGNYFQTENRYQIYVYFKALGGRTWQLVAFRQAEFK